MPPRLRLPPRYIYAQARNQLTDTNAVDFAVGDMNSITMGTTEEVLRERERKGGTSGENYVKFIKSRDACIGTREPVCVRVRVRVRVVCVATWCAAWERGGVSAPRKPLARARLAPGRAPRLLFRRRQPLPICGLDRAPPRSLPPRAHPSAQVAMLLAAGTELAPSAGHDKIWQPGEAAGCMPDGPQLGCHHSAVRGDGRGLTRVCAAPAHSARRPTHGTYIHARAGNIHDLGI